MLRPSKEILRSLADSLDASKLFSKPNRLLRRRRFLPVKLTDTKTGFRATAAAAARSDIAAKGATKSVNGFNPPPPV